MQYGRLKKPKNKCLRYKLQTFFLASALGIVTPWGGDALARLRFNSAAGGPSGPTGAR